MFYVKAERKIDGFRIMLAEVGQLNGIPQLGESLDIFIIGTNYKIPYTGCIKGFEKIADEMNVETDSGHYILTLRNNGFNPWDEVANG